MGLRGRGCGSWMGTQGGVEGSEGEGMWFMVSEEGSGGVEVSEGAW